MRAKSVATDDDDAELVARVSQGDEEAFTHLVAKHHGRVFRLVRGIVADWHLTEDVCQDVFVTVYRKLPGFRGQSRFATWLYRVAVNAALKSQRRRSRNSREYSVGDAGSLPEVAGFYRDREAAFEGEEVVRRLLRPLPEPLRVAVLLRDAMGLNYEEIATVLGCSQGAVEQRLHRAMKQLRELWKEERDKK